LADPTQVIETGPDPLDDQSLDTCTAAANGDLTIDTTATASIKGIWERVTRFDPQPRGRAPRPLTTPERSAVQ